MKIVFRTLRSLLLCMMIANGTVMGGNVLFVVGGTPLGPGDDRIKTLLESKNHVLTIKTGSAAVAADATGKSLVVVSSTVLSADVGGKFRNVTVPVMVWESHILDDMGMTNGAAYTDYGTVDGMTQVQINLPSHQMAAGFNGGVAVYNGSGSRGAYGRPASSALKIATVVEDVTRAQIFGYETGAAMFALNAPARRVGFFLDDLTPVDMNDNGVKLFHAAVNWAMNVSQPVITQHPVSTSVNVGQTAAFSVAASGGALTYQWRRNGVNIDGATGYSYTTPATVASNNGDVFSVMVSNSAGDVTSNNAVLSVGNSSPVISIQPRDRAVEEGQTTTFSVEAAGTGLSYVWRRGTVNDGGTLVVSNISGATGSSYTIPPATMADHNSTYTCVVTNSAGSATSRTAELLVVKIPRIAETQYSEEINSATPSFKLGWNKDGVTPNIYFEQGGVERLKLQEHFVTIPNTLNFGPNGSLGFNWTQDPNSSVERLSLGTGNHDTPHFSAIQLVRTAEGFDGLFFPKGFRFPDWVLNDNGLEWEVQGKADETGMLYERILDNPIDQRKTETNQFGVAGLGFTAEHTNSISGGLDPFYVQYSSSQDANALVLERYSGTTSEDDVLEASTTITADAVSTDMVNARVVVASDVVTTPKWKVSQLPDYVFEEDYALPSLEEVEAFTRKHKHLPNMPSAKVMAEKGINLTEMNIQLLKTVEELTLHVMALKKEVRDQKREMKRLTESGRLSKQGKTEEK